ncbi:MAG: cell division protein FtsA [Patescibacteria group bacterium]|nr:cell division protein FtsA [Patescibacteria group bacterium]
MSKEDYIIALDVGSSHVRTVVAQIIVDEKPRIIGVGVASANGIRRGVVADIEEVSNSITNSIGQAEKNSGVKIESVYVSIGGGHIECEEVKGVIAVGRADSEVVEGDVERVIEAAQAISLPPNKEILHIIPQNFRLDDQEGIKDPVGMNGVRLEMQGLVVTGSTPHIRNISKCVESNGYDIDGFVISPLAAAKAVLSKRQKELGVVSVDIGGGTTSMAVFEESELIHIAVLPVGASHITNDIAIGLRTSIDVAEKVKLKYGSALSEEIGKNEQIDLAGIDVNEEGSVSRRHVAEIIEARIEEIFYLVEKELKKIGRSALLPAGAVLTGGGACMQGSVDLAKEILKLPAQAGFPIELTGLVDKVDNPAFSVSVGMIVWVVEETAISAPSSGSSGFLSKSELFTKVSSVKDSAKTMRKWFGKFLP